jgi:hypothetical protein
MRGVIVAFFAQGWGFVKPMTDPDDRWSTIGDGYFYHMNDSPLMPDVIHRWEDIVGSFVDFDVVPDPDSDGRMKAINLSLVGHEHD